MRVCDAAFHTRSRRGAKVAAGGGRTTVDIAPAWRRRFFLFTAATLGLVCEQDMFLFLYFFKLFMGGERIFCRYGALGCRECGGRGGLRLRGALLCFFLALARPSTEVPLRPSFSCPV
eukprot:scaffold1692_cov133-Isochrysis_galbana.AAC.2